MTFVPHGCHLIAGEWIAGERKFQSSPAFGSAYDFSIGTPVHVAAACTAAEQAFQSYGHRSRADRATFLNAIANEIEARADAITQIGHAETGLPVARIESERARTTSQLRLFAQHIQSGSHLDMRHDLALPDRKPAPRPDIRLMQRPIGPVAVFGASNFPLAFSTAGGDTAAALAAGCSVVVKGHSAHPGTAEIVAEAIRVAIRSTGMPPGVFSLIQGGNRQVGEALVQNPLIVAVGFTGSLSGGRALFDLCAARPEPIPFFGELGSVNPNFVLPQALASRGDSIAMSWVRSLTLGVGQFCTNPGIMVLTEGPDAERFTAAARAALEGVGQQMMLSESIANAYRTGRDQIRNHADVTAVFESDSPGRTAGPNLSETTAKAFLRNPHLAEEVFGPFGLIVRVERSEAMIALAQSFAGQLTATLHMDDADVPLARRLLPLLERKAGRVLANGFSTGVEVCDAMVHSGPYPASTNFGATSVGTLSIRRFLRPVSYQNLPASILPDDLMLGLDDVTAARRH